MNRPRPAIVPPLNLTRDTVYSVPSKIVFKRGSSSTKKVLLIKCGGWAVRRCIVFLPDRDDSTCSTSVSRTVSASAGASAAAVATAAAAAAMANRESAGSSSVATSTSVMVRCEEKECVALPSFAGRAVGFRLVPDKAARFAVILVKEKQEASLLRVFVEGEESPLCVSIVVEGKGGTEGEKKGGVPQSQAEKLELVPKESDFDAIDKVLESMAL